MSDTRPSTPHGLFSWLGQLVLYGLFALAIGVFSQWPPYHPLGAEQALIKLSVSHVGKPIGECRKLSQAELDKLPPNMRFPEQCPRERAPLTMRVELDGKSVLDRVVPPTGLSKDGASSIYERLAVPAGNHHLEVSLNDDVRPGAQTYTRSADVTLAPGQVLVVDFDANQGAIVLQ
ncbi:MAG: hypothetical protein KF903_06525 [Dokdonella sp.]|uniref:hypothetical protein n=1 Tax=Dokdonella sp. TaxID=2291710 RepID=UPI0025BC32C7|nr:hypothetical protein [Dokdonella sp.]MBX3700641.1 hypothetical protein [Dokdonella sp.]MCW5578548.1 hypothetical protein [Dokdonella sp.]